MFQRRRFFQGRPIRGSGIKDIVWLKPDGGEMTDAEWQQSHARCLGVYLSGDGLTGVGMAVFESTGYTESGKAFDRPGRATVVLGRRVAGEEWVAQHTHVSLFPGTPSRSFGTKREHPPAL